MYNYIVFSGKKKTSTLYVLGMKTILFCNNIPKDLKMIGYGMEG